MLENSTGPALSHRCLGPNVFDFDGVITVGIIPKKGDIIITGRGFDECSEVYEFIDNISGIPGYHKNFPIYFNPKTRSNNRTRECSANHKRSTIISLLSSCIDIQFIFEDDPLQAKTIQSGLDWWCDKSIVRHKPKIVMIECDWVEK